MAVIPTGHEQVLVSLPLRPHKVTISKSGFPGYTEKNKNKNPKKHPQDSPFPEFQSRELEKFHFTQEYSYLPHGLRVITKAMEG